MSAFIKKIKNKLLLDLFMLSVFKKEERRRKRKKKLKSQSVKNLLIGSL